MRPKANATTSGQCWGPPRMQLSGSMYTLLWSTFHKNRTYLEFATSGSPKYCAYTYTVSGVSFYSVCCLSGAEHIISSCWSGEKHFFSRKQEAMNGLRGIPSLQQLTSSCCCSEKRLYDSWQFHPNKQILCAFIIGGNVKSQTLICWSVYDPFICKELLLLSFHSAWYLYSPCDPPPWSPKATAHDTSSRVCGKACLLGGCMRRGKCNSQQQNKNGNKNKQTKTTTGQELFF